MPIKPENRDRYPADWPEIRELIRARAGDRCEWCGAPNRTIVLRYRPAPWLYWHEGVNQEWFRRAVGEMATGTLDVTINPDREREWRAVEIVCTVAHVHDKRPENCDERNLAFLCQRCHLEHDRGDR